MAKNERILIVDDDVALRRELAEQLTMHEGFRVVEAGSGKEALSVVKGEEFDLVILDVGLPDTDGRDLCKLLRKNGVKAPVIMLTGRDGDADEVLALESGANDYVTKPFRMWVLMARIRAHLRQHELSDDAIFPVGPYQFRPASKMLTVGNRKIHLTEKEAAILKYLYRIGDKPVPREVLLDEVWGYNTGVTTHTLETHIYRLRQKVEPNPGQVSLIVTEAGGYRLAR